MPSYKLTYFNIRGRAEPTRLMFAQAGVEYDDIRVTGEEFVKMKADTKALPLGQLPVLEVDGVIISQSMAILRFVGHELGLAPSSNLDRARADQVVDAIEDLLLKMRKFNSEKDEANKESLTKEFFGTTLPLNMRFFENLLKSNKEGTGFLAGDKLTYADIHFFNFFNAWLGNGKSEVPDQLKDSSILVSLYNRVMEMPNIRKWIENRPESLY